LSPVGLLPSVSSARRTQRARGLKTRHHPVSLSPPARPSVLASVPSLDDIARNPRMAIGLPQSTVRALLRRCAAVQSTLVLELDAEKSAGQSDAAPAADDDHMLTPKEVSLLLRRSVRWVYRNKKKISVRPPAFAPIVRMLRARRPPMA